MKIKIKERLRTLADRQKPRAARLQCEMTSQTSLLLPTTIKISQVNSLTDEDFIIKFGNVIEHCSLVAAAVAKSRPFQSLQHLHAEICSFIDELPVKDVMRS
ncbi:2-oxo-4-hydroxy-4-carboxy-5-ureidoimidazoline decarboxylase [Portunus trituberculatus]|uniref:2-oxo-4-hydroxy-4-carboxy-5-ureidoimidazoline decarboxylase n=1 Tax=Portunus trituberculatus TaxID=210409 RepID=A0A5B7J4R5_PORTR|nr:2-oxo-4-hydroxy-4-carboxy-5-ureidoimidazoline decarboxylase [Portunus trituberculatus]